MYKGVKKIEKFNYYMMLKIIHNQTRTKPNQAKAHTQTTAGAQPTPKHSQDGLRFTETYRRRCFTIS